ncbi:MAG: MFS transporter [Caldilineaceae bacterium]|nr:MFS transporter [Caldilineaceae bacterium]
MSSAQPGAGERAGRRWGITRFRHILAACIAARLAVDTTTQLFFPFLQTIALGMAIDIVLLGRLVSLRSLAGLSAPLFGAAADRYGYRRLMRLSLLLAAAGMYLLGSGWGIWSVVAGMVVSGMGLTGFLPTCQAYISARLPFAQRARGIGALEYSWALAGIVGLSLMGFLFGRFSWQLPFMVLATAMLAGWVLLRLLPEARGEAARKEVAAARAREVAPRRLRSRSLTPLLSTLPPLHVGRVAGLFDLGANWRAAFAVICANGLFYFSQVHILIAHGAWLQTEYGLAPESLGLVALAQGGADLCGSVLVSLITDRVGKKRAVQAGMLGSLLVYSSLPFINVGLIPVIAALVLLRFVFEYGIVSAIALISEQAPDRRAKMISLSVALNLVGSTVSGFTGPWMYTRFGVWGLGPVATVGTLAAVVLLTVWGRESA